jgi:hypothetical protein
LNVKRARQKNKCFATRSNLCFILSERERKQGREGGREGGKFWEAEVPGGREGREPAEPARATKEGCASPDCPPATSHSVQDVAKKIQRANALAPQHGTPARESQRRAPALPRGRSVAATAEATQSVFPPSNGSPQPEAFPTRNNFACPEASLLLPLLLSPNGRPLLPYRLPGVSNSASPQPEAFLTRNLFACPGLLLPYPRNLLASPPPPPLAVCCPALSENTAPRLFWPSFCLTPPPPPPQSLDELK